MQILRKTVEKFGNHEALIVPYQNYRATYQEFWDQTTEIAKALLANNVKPGDRVGIWAANRYEWVVISICNGPDGSYYGQYQSGLSSG